MIYYTKIHNKFSEIEELKNKYEFKVYTSNYGNDDIMFHYISIYVIEYIIGYFVGIFLIITTTPSLSICNLMTSALVQPYLISTILQNKEANVFVV